MEYFNWIGNVFTNNWLIVAFIAPALWALVNVIDVYFVGGVYDDEYDGVIISSLFQMVPWAILIFFIDLDFSPYLGWTNNGAFQFNLALLLSFLGGFVFCLATFFYFKALFGENDVVLLQIIWNSASIVVPVLTFLIFGEKLGFYKYIGIGIVFLGAVLLSVSSRIKLKLSRKYLAMMFGGVFFVSLSMILGDRAYLMLGVDSVGGNGFWVGYFFFSLGFLVFGVALMLLRKKNVLSLIFRYHKIFLFAEALSFVGIMASQRAIDISPSVSFVATIEAFCPLFVAVFSFGILGYMYLFGKKNELFKTIYKEQVTGIGIKILAAVFMAWGVYMISA